MALFLYHILDQMGNIILCISCRSFAAVGVDPAVMGVGPAAAIPVAVKSAGLQLDDIDLFEINEVICLLDRYVLICFSWCKPKNID